MAEFPVHPGRAVMAFGFAEVASVDEVLSRVPAAVTALMRSKDQQP